MTSLEKQCFAFFAAADGAKDKEIAEIQARIDADNAEVDAAKARGEVSESDPYRAVGMVDGQAWVLGTKRGLR